VGKSVRLFKADSRVQVIIDNHSSVSQALFIKSAMHSLLESN